MKQNCDFPIYNFNKGDENMKKYISLSIVIFLIVISIIDMIK